VEIHSRETKHFSSIKELELYQQNELRKLLEGTPTTAPIKQLQFHYRGPIVGTAGSEPDDLTDGYGIVLEEEKIVDIDPLNGEQKK
jgi:hypothetical protein